MKAGARALEFLGQERSPRLLQSLFALLHSANRRNSVRHACGSGVEERPQLKNLNSEETEQDARIFFHSGQHQHKVLGFERALCVDYPAFRLSVVDMEATSLQANSGTGNKDSKTLLNPEGLAPRSQELGTVGPENGVEHREGLENATMDARALEDGVWDESKVESGGRDFVKDRVVDDVDVNLAKRLKVESIAVVPHAAKAWEHWNKLGAPMMVVAPMVDQSELPFRMLCRKYGATAAYTPMLHSRLFSQDVKYRKDFTTCQEDRPLFVQFCANNPDTLLEAGKLVQDECDYVDINFGCPQRIAKRGNYGAFLMDDLPLVRSLVEKLSSGLTTPVSCKIRMFPKLEDTLAYARMLEEAGCSLLAVHGRTRDQKDGKAIRADWDVIKAVKSALSIPVLANGNIQWLEDVEACMKATGVDGIMSAESLLENPALFSGHRMQPVDAVIKGISTNGSLNEPLLVLEYLDLCEKYPVPARMIRAHVHRILGPWFRRYPEVREDLNKQYKLTTEWLKDMVQNLIAKHKASIDLQDNQGKEEQSIQPAIVAATYNNSSESKILQLTSNGATCVVAPLAPALV